MSVPCPVLIINDTRIDGHHGCTAVMTALERLLVTHGMTVAARWPAHAEWRDDPIFDRALARARLVVVNGEGTIHHDRPAGRRLLEIGAAARAASVPAVLVNTGWEANGQELTALLADFALVAARDTTSAAAIRVSAPGVRVVPDLSLCIPPPSEPRQRRELGFTDNVVGLQALDLEQLRQAVNGRSIGIHHRKPITTFLRAGISLREDMFKPVQLLRLIGMRHAMWRVAHDDLERFVADLSGLTLLVSGRFHACTLALVAGTPFVAQASNTGKIAALVKDAGLEPFRAELPPDSATLLDIAARGWSQAEDEARRDYISDATAAASSLATDLRALVG